MYVACFIKLFVLIIVLVHERGKAQIVESIKICLHSNGSDASCNYLTYCVVSVLGFRHLCACVCVCTLIGLINVVY